MKRRLFKIVISVLILMNLTCVSFAASFKELSAEIDKTIDMLEDEKKIFEFRSDYVKVKLAEELYDLCFVKDFHNESNQNKVTFYIDYLEQFRSVYNPITALTQVQNALQNVAGFKSKELLSEYINLLTDGVEEELEKERLDMAESKYVLVNINNITPSEIVFSDINENDWYYQTVLEMARLGLFKGKTEAVNGVSVFCPDNTITRAEFLAVLLRMIFPVIEKDDSKWYKQNIYTNERTETDEKPWYADYSHMAQKYDIGHMGNTYFFTFMDVPIKREEMAQLISRAVHLSRKWSFDADLFEKTDTNILIPDYSEVDDIYKNGVKITYLEKIIMGKDDKGNFDPKGNATRAEAAAVLYRFLKR